MFVDTIQADTVGTANGSREAIGTVTLNAKCKRVLGFLINAVSTGTMTTAEALSGSIHFSSEDLSIPRLEFQSNLGLGGAPGTNINDIQQIPKWIPWEIPNRTAQVAGRLKNSRLDFEYEAAQPEPTSDAAAQVAVVYDELDTPPNIVEELKTWHPEIMQPAWSSYASDDELGDAVSETWDENFTIPSYVNEIVGFSSKIVDDADPTAGEHKLAFADYTSTIPDIAPFELPLPASNAGLGTAVGNPVVAEEFNFPFYLKKASVANETLTPTLNLQQVTSGAFLGEITAWGR